MKRVFALLMALMALTMMLTLTACGGDEPEETPAPEQTETVDPGTEEVPEVTEPAAGADLAGLMAQMIADAGIADYIEVPAENLSNVYGIDTAQVVNAAAFNAMTGGAFPEEVVMIQAVDEAAAADMVAKLEGRLTSIADQAASYDPASLELAENCDVVTSGVYVGLFFSNHYDAMVSAFQSAVG
ncbi:MAG: DUF4358 domain-containing protein [Ruminiclostridium sp.]|nr:DUF4358 domain-containing protein [Ruminiclostridium sp.]